MDGFKTPSGSKTLNTEDDVDIAWLCPQMDPWCTKGNSDLEADEIPTHNPSFMAA